MKRKRVRRKKTIVSKKEEEESDENEPFSMITMDLKMEIMTKLPVKSIAKLNLVSKQWASMISSKGFTELYMKRSSTRPRLLLALYRGYRSLSFKSYSQEDPSSEHDRVSITPNLDVWYDFSPPIRGLICCIDGDGKLVVGNPSTGQFVNLPKVITRRVGLVSFLGYDPVNDVYKVLCMTVKKVFHKRGSQVVSEEHRVFTLGAQEPWRKIECKHPHLPPYLTRGLSMNGFVYYYGWIKSEGSLICFDVRTEEFNVIQLPEDLRFLEPCNLANYCGKIALTNRSYDGTLDLRVLEDASKQEWSRVDVVVPSWRELAGRYMFSFRGALSSGELIFASDSFIKPFYYISYDLKENNAKRVVIEEIGDDYNDIKIFFDHVENPIFL